MKSLRLVVEVLQKVKCLIGKLKFNSFWFFSVIDRVMYLKTALSKKLSVIPASSARSHIFKATKSISSCAARLRFHHSQQKFYFSSSVVKCCTIRMQMICKGLHLTLNCSHHLLMDSLVKLRCFVDSLTVADSRFLVEVERYREASLEFRF